MVNNYPLIFRTRVVEYYLFGPQTPIKEILNIFKISNGSLYNWVYQYKTNMLIEKKQYTKPQKMFPIIKEFIKKYITEHPFLHIRKLISEINKVHHIMVCKSTIYNTLNNMQITYKKTNKRFIYKDKNKYNDELRIHKEKLKTINLSKIISIDETHFDSYESPNYGWNKKGYKLRNNTHIKKLYRYTIICAISNKKILNMKIVKNSADKYIFNEFITDTINKNNLKGYHLLMDNAAIHHSRIVKETITKSNNYPLYNVAYTPELNPIELLFSKVKQQVRSYMDNHILDNLLNNIKTSFKNTTNGFFDKIYKRTFHFV